LTHSCSSSRQLPQRFSGFSQSSSKRCYSRTNILRQQDDLDDYNDTNDRDDDEFIFPVQLSMEYSPHQWLWSGADISRLIDLGSDSFAPEKKIIYSTKNLKVLNVRHKTHGDVLFTLIPDLTNEWKICNVAIFGDASSHSLSNNSDYITPQKINLALGSMLDILNDKEHKLGESSSPILDIFSHPYQYVCPPYSIKITESICNFFMVARDKATSCVKVAVTNSFEHSQHLSSDTSVKQRTLMRSKNLALVSVDIFSYDRGTLDAIYELLVLLEQSSVGSHATEGDEDNALSFHPQDGSSNFELPSASSEGAGPHSRVLITSLMIGAEKKAINR